MSDATKLIALGVPSQVAAEIARQIDEAVAAAVGYTDADAVNAVAVKPEIAALTGASTSGDIVAALQA